LLVISGCSSSKTTEPPINEIPTTDVVTTDAPEAELYARGKRYFERGIYGDAKEAFQAIMTNFPLGPYAEFAEVKFADSVYESGDFITAATLYQDTLKNRPASENTSYVLYRSARSLHLSQNGIGRDMTNLEKALGLYDELATRFPNSPFTLASREYQQEATEKLKEHQESIASFYGKQRNFKAMAERETLIAERFPSLEEKNKINLAAARSKLDQERSTAVAKTTLPTTIQESRSTEQIPTIKPVAKQINTSARENSKSKENILATHMECDPEGHFVTVYLDRPISSAVIAETARKATRTDDYVSLSLPAFSIKGLRVECDGLKAEMNNSLLRISPSGELSGFTLAYPPRLIFQLD